MSLLRCIGIIGLGDMGQLYARTFSRAGLGVWGCDLPHLVSHRAQVLAEYPSVCVTDSLELTIKNAQLIIFSVEASALQSVMAAALPFIELNPKLIVMSQSAVKSLEAQCFENLLPKNVSTAFCHSLHGPSLPTRGQTLVLVPHRCSSTDFLRIQQLFQVFRSHTVFLPNALEHDRCMADIQAVTHLCFQSMGLAWVRAKKKPWESIAYASLVDRIKTLLMLRIFCGKAHVYRELAFSNPHAGIQIQTYCRNVEKLIALIAQNRRQDFLNHICEARDAVFGAHRPENSQLSQFDLSSLMSHEVKGNSKNSHLSLYAMVSTWAELGIQPLNLLAVQTPPFRLRLDIAEYVLFSRELFKESIETAFSDKDIRADDSCYLEAVQLWTHAVTSQDTAQYDSLFDAVKMAFVQELERGRLESDKLINLVSEMA